jgi:hypothetical protein
MRRRLIAAALLIPTVLFGATAAVADRAHPRVVSVDPVNFTPHILDGTVWAMAVVGDTVVVGGSFTQVADRSRTYRYNRRNIFAYGLNDGVIRPFAPAVDGAVYALAPGAGGTVYLGGSFKTVNRVAQRGLARLTLANQRVATFTAKINWGDVRALAVQGNRLYAGGTFSAVNGVARVGLARMNASTGGVDTGFDARLSAPGLSRTRVEHFDLSPDGRKLVAIGALLKAGPHVRTQIVVLDVAGAAQVANWWTDAYKPQCMAGFDTYLRQVKFAPNGAYFVVVATGRESSPIKLCDSAARFETGGVGRHNPTWVQRTGGDSLYAVAVTGAAVYVGGHQRYLDNALGSDAKGPGPGAVERIGIGALNPTTGKAYTWNPSLQRGVGPRTFVATPQGLLVGYDKEYLGREYHARLGMFPLN